MLLTKDVLLVHKAFMSLELMIVTLLSTWVILQMMLELIEIPAVLSGFAGLMVIFEIDVWIGFIFETLLDNKYRGIVSGA